MAKNTRRAATYAVLARVSTRDQKEGHSLDSQIEAGRKYAKQSGATSILEYKGVESATGDERDILERALTDAEEGKYVALIIQDLSRLSRNPAVMFSAISRLKQAGVVLHDLNGPIPVETPEGEFRVMIESVVGRYTARQSVQKSINARVRILETGGIAAGRPPWGRRWNRGEKRFERIHEKEQLLKDVYRLIVRQRKSLNQVALQFGMANSSLRKAIFQSSQSEVIQRLGGRDYRIPCPPLLTQHQQQLIQQRLGENRIVRPTTKSRYLLQGLVRCAACGSTMTGQTGTKDAKQYSVYRHPPSPRYKPGCVWQVPTGLLDDEILTVCANTIADDVALRSAIEAAIEDQNSGAIEIRERLNEVERDVERSSMRLDRILERLAVFEEGSESLKRLKARASREEFALAQLVSTRDELVNQAKLIGLPADTAEAVVAKVRTLYWGSGAAHDRRMTFEQRREFVRTFVGRITRNSPLGIFVRMLRASGASKKNVKWAYKLVGNLVLASNYMARGQDNRAPWILELRAHSPEQVNALAAIANSTVGVKLPDRSRYNMQLRKKYS